MEKRIPVFFFAPFVSSTMRVAPEWIDYNGHMTEARYLQVFADTSDALLLFAGVDEDYHARGCSYFTVETHIVHKREVRALEPVHVETQILSVDEKRLHIFHRMIHTPTCDQLATAEQMLLHVDTNAQKVCSAEPAILTKFREVARAHADLPRPEEAGRAVGKSRPDDSEQLRQA